MLRVGRWFVYMLQCADGSLYTGITTDVKRRLAQHNSGKGSRAVRGKLPARLVYQKSLSSRISALKREAEIKKWPRAKKLSLAVGCFTFFLLLLLAAAVPCHSLESAEDYMKLGNEAFEKGDYDAAIHDYTLALGVDPDRIDVYLNRGSAYHNKGLFDKAIQNYDDAVNLNPNNLLCYQYRAVAYFEKEQYQKSWQDVKTLESLGGAPDPDFLEKLKAAADEKKQESTGSSIDEVFPTEP